MRTATRHCSDRSTENRITTGAVQRPAPQFEINRVVRLAHLAPCPCRMRRALIDVSMPDLISLNADICYAASWELARCPPRGRVIGADDQQALAKKVSRGAAGHGRPVSHFLRVKTDSACKTSPHCRAPLRLHCRPCTATPPLPPSHSHLALLI